MKTTQLILSALIACFTLNASAEYQWQTVSEQAINDIDTGCNQYALSEKDAAKYFSAASGAGVAMTLVFAQTLTASGSNPVAFGVGASVGFAALEAGIIASTYPGAKDEFIMFLDDLQNGASTSRTDKFRDYLKEQNKDYDKALSDLNKLLLSDTRICTIGQSADAVQEAQ